MLTTLAQTTQPVLDSELWRPSSITAIVALTMLVVQYAIKPMFGRVPSLERVPVLLYIVGVAAGLVVLANRVLGTLPGDNLGLLIWDAVFSALAASGLYTALPIGAAPSAMTPLGDTATSKNRVVLPLLLIALMLPLGSAGCAAIAQSPLGKAFTAATPADKVAAANRTYATIANSLADSIRKGLITDPETIRAIRQANGEINAALDVAKVLAESGDEEAFNKLWPGVLERIDRFIIEYVAKRQRKETSWNGSRSAPPPPAFSSSSSARRATTS